MFFKNFFFFEIKCVLRAINLSLRLQETNKCIVECFTANVVMEDDLLPLLDNLQLGHQHRNISSVHLKISAIMAANAQKIIQSK